MIDPTKAEEMREAIEYEIRMGVDLSLAINMTAPQHEEHIGEMSRKITDIFTSALEAQDVESRIDELEGVLIISGFSKDKQMRAVSKRIKDLQSHPTKQSEKGRK